MTNPQTPLHLEVPDYDHAVLVVAWPVKEGRPWKATKLIIEKKDIIDNLGLLVEKFKHGYNQCLDQKS